MGQVLDHHSPLDQSMSTPSDVSVGTPYANAVASPSGGPSPLSSALWRKTSVERAQLFFKGQYQQLVASMSTEEQVYVLHAIRPVDVDAASEPCPPGYTSSGFSRSRLPSIGVGDRATGLQTSSPSVEMGSKIFRCRRLPTRRLIRLDNHHECNFQAQVDSIIQASTLSLHHCVVGQFM